MVLYNKEKSKPEAYRSEYRNCKRCLTNDKNNSNNNRNYTKKVPKSNSNDDNYNNMDKKVLLVYIIEDMLG